MKRSRVAFGVFAAGLALVGIVAGYRAARRAESRQTRPPATASAAPAHESFLYGRITTIDGVRLEGRLRWGGGEEAFWGDYFNGVRIKNSWGASVAPERLPREQDPLVVFGKELFSRDRPMELSRLFLARFGDIARVEAGARDVRVTLKSGTEFELDRSEASDFDDGVRVWDRTRGVVDLDSLRIRAIEFLPAPATGDAPHRLHGVVRTRGGEFRGFIQWDREQCIGSDPFKGATADGDVSLRFETIGSIARIPGDGLAVTLRDGREMEFSGGREGGSGSRGVYVDDVRYSRLLVSWEAFERVEFTLGTGGPAYGDYPPGGPLTGSVATRGGRRVTGRLVFDLDESEITETLDAPLRGVNYNIPFGLIATIELPGAGAGGVAQARVTLHSGEALTLERGGDLGPRNAGMLVFVEGGRQPEYVPFAEVSRIDLERPRAMYPRVE